MSLMNDIITINKLHICELHIEYFIQIRSQILFLAMLKSVFGNVFFNKKNSIHEMGVKFGNVKRL